jgi:hypothetical protein
MKLANVKAAPQAVVDTAAVAATAMATDEIIPLAVLDTKSSCRQSPNLQNIKDSSSQYS